MRPVQHTVRLPIALDKALKGLSERHSVSVYAMLQSSVKAGVAALERPSVPDNTNREIVAELAFVSTRIIDIERMLDRALFTTCAAYCYARSAATGIRAAQGGLFRGVETIARLLAGMRGQCGAGTFAFR